MKDLVDRIDRDRAEEARQRAEDRRWSDSQPGEYREGFVDGYLRSHADGGEYACSIEEAELAFGRYLSEGGRGLPRQDVEHYPGQLGPVRTKGEVQS